MMTKEESTKIVNFMTQGTGVLVLGRRHISDLVKMQFNLNLPGGSREILTVHVSYGEGRG